MDSVGIVTGTTSALLVPRSREPSCVDCARRTATPWLLIALLWWPAAGSAQCGARVTQCRQCHELDRVYPVLAGAPWHRDHAFGDFCAQCHGGDAEATDPALAHTGLSSPMSDTQASCGKCHDPASVEHAYAPIARGVGSWRNGPPPAGGAGRATQTSVAWRNGLAATALGLLGAAGAGYIVRNERQLRSRSAGQRSAP